MASKWDMEQIPDQSGRVAVVTGANSGIGFEAAKALAAKGAKVIFACRNLDKARDAMREVHEELADADVEVMELDLSSLESVRSFATTFRKKYPVLHLLINNAGVMAIPRRETAEGFEMQFGTNHLGHFALTGLLLDSLRQAGGARIVNVASQAHRMGRMNFDDLQGESRYDKWAAYGQSKLSNLLFTFELDRRLAKAGLDINAVAAHPGYAATNLQSVGPDMSGSVFSAAVMKVGNALFSQDQRMGSLPTLYAATANDVAGGDYIGPDGIMEMRGHPKKVGTHARARREEDWARLWDRSENLTGVHYGF